MSNHEGLFKKINAVMFFSPSGESKKVACFLNQTLQWNLIDITAKVKREQLVNYNFQNLLLVFPVYSQNIPEPVRKVIKQLTVDKAIIIVTYGYMGTGNVLYEVQKILNGNIVGGAYVPSKHTYLERKMSTTLYNLLPLINNFNSNELVRFPHRHKHLMANFFTHTRGLFNVKISKNASCINCHLCDDLCPVGAINGGKINNMCIRCLRCYHNCKQGGLDIKYGYFLKKYLKKERIKELIIYKQ